MYSSFLISYIYNISYAHQFIIYVSLFLLYLTYILINLTTAFTAKLISHDVIRLCLDKKKSSYPGQYVLLIIPLLGILNWYPYIISSSPNEDDTTLHISQLNEWTNKLKMLVQEKDNKPIMGFVIEGIYKLPTYTHVQNSKHETIIIITGGDFIHPYENEIEDASFFSQDFINSDKSLVANMLELKDNAIKSKSIQILVGKRIVQNINYATKKVSYTNTVESYYSNKCIPGINGNIYKLLLRTKEFSLRERKGNIGVYISGRNDVIAAIVEICNHFTYPITNEKIFDIMLLNHI